MSDHVEEIIIEARDLPVERYCILIGDGMGDFPMKELSGKSVLEAARTPAMDRMSRLGEIGTVQTIPDGFTPGSGVANMTLLGYDPRRFYTGRGALEAAALGLSMNPEDIAFRCNLVTLGFKEGRVFMIDYSAGHITNQEARILIEDFAPTIAGRSFHLYPGVSYRNLLMWHGGPEGLATVPPHDYTGMDVTNAWHIYEEEPLLYEVLTKAITFFHKHPVNEKRRQEGKRPANALWPWGQGRKPIMPTMKERFGINGAVVAAVDLIKGLGKWAGLEVIEVKGATGYLDTDYSAKASAAIGALKEKELVVLHLEAPDEAGHMGNLKEKMKAIERFDKEIVTPVWDALKDMGVTYRLMVVTDHFTPIRLRTHCPYPVPYCIFDSTAVRDNPEGAFSERVAERSKIDYPEGHELFERFIGVPPATA